MRKIFISYRRSDSLNISKRIYNSLVERFGKESIFMDIDNLYPGTNFKTHLHTALNECSVFLEIIGPEWADVLDEQGQRRLDNPEDFLRFEIESALERNVLIIPVLLNGTPMPQRKFLPASIVPLIEYQAALLSEEEYDIGINNLIHLIELYILPASTNTEENPPPTHEQPNIEARFFLGHLLPTNRYRSQFISLPYPEKSNATFNVTCRECGETINIEMPGLQNTIRSRSMVKNMAISFGISSVTSTILYFAAYVIIINPLATYYIDNNDFSHYNSVIETSLLLVVLLIFSIGPILGNILVERSIVNGIKCLTNYPSLLEKPPYASYLSPYIIQEDYSRIPQNVAFKRHRLIRLDKTAFLITERRRGLRLHDLRIPIEDRF